MFWKRETPKPATRPQLRMSSDGSSPVSAEASLDALAEFLRSFGKGAFDLETKSAVQVQERCEAWARHLLVGVEPPDYPAEADDWEPGADAPRDLQGLRRFMADTRQEEHSFIGRRLSNMLEAIWTFIAGMRQALVFEQQTDEQVAHRLRRLESAARGNSTEQLKREALETVSMLRQCMQDRGAHQQALVENLGTRLETLRSELTVVREQAACDGLTGLYNRASLDEHLERIVDLRNLFGRESTLFMIDIDHFKWVNDTHGHPAGDTVLREVANCLANCFSRTEDFVARYGGEEFVVVLQEGRAGDHLDAQRALPPAPARPRVRYWRGESAHLGFPRGIGPPHARISGCLARTRRPGPLRGQGIGARPGSRACRRSRLKAAPSQSIEESAAGFCQSLAGVRVDAYGPAASPRARQPRLPELTRDSEQLRMSSIGY
ncbi:MAG: diguanylate cyclase [Myxococcales bacterium]|nr:diguanylate cyclase [Myxococcales bacterium]